MRKRTPLAAGKEVDDDSTSLRSFLQGSPIAGQTQEGESNLNAAAHAQNAPSTTDSQKRLQSFRTRTLSTVVLISGYIFFVWAGHVPLMFLVFMLQEQEKLPGFRAQQWYFFFVSVFYLYTRFIANNLLVEVSSTKTLARLFSWALKRQMFISFFLYCAGFIMFVLSLKRGMYLYQFTQYAWTHMTILVVIMPTSFFVSNVFQGIIWYLLPAMLIIVNDIFAYLAGFFFGRTPLILLSPKKTWEGFIGGFACTVAFAFSASWVMAQFSWLTCPRKDLSLGPLSCEPSPIFQARAFTIPELAIELPGPLEELLVLLHSILPSHMWNDLQAVSVTAMPLQLHAMTMACFASLISPFGGFFASGFKRAFQLKDFGDTIPGHGGITDRFDCQVLMAMFSYLYYWNYIHVEVPNVGNVLTEALKLPNAQQLELFVRLGNLLIGAGQIPDNSLDSVSALVNLSGQ